MQDLTRTTCAGRLNLIIYYSHGTETVRSAIFQHIATLKQTFEGVPLIVLSDDFDAEDPATIRGALNCGARAFIPTQRTGIRIVLAAIRVVHAGGSFAPLDLLLGSRHDTTNQPSRSEYLHCLTSQQARVLFLLQKGKANKNIAYELGLSESTVKVHVRNIMRRMGATNRTQAAYKAQVLWGEKGFAGSVGHLD